MAPHQRRRQRTARRNDDDNDHVATSVSPVRSKNLRSVQTGGATDDYYLYRHGKKRAEADEPFLWLFLKVGATLAVSLLVFLVLPYRYYYFQRDAPPVVDVDDDDDDFEYSAAAADKSKDTTAAIDKDADHSVKHAAEAAMLPPSFPTQIPTLAPTVQLSPTTSGLDAYGTAEFLLNNNNNNTIVDKQLQLFVTAAAGLRRRFAQRYGGERVARHLLEQTLVDNLTHNVRSTACRLQHGQRRHFVFTGYSVTAGRGNYFNQAFPQQFQRLLRTPVELLWPAEGLLEVQNTAVGGCPSFPTGWCMLPSILDQQPTDVVSWDFSMNEAGGEATGLEAYLRRVTQLPSRPLLIVKETAALETTDRQILLERYNREHGVDSLLIRTERVVRPFLQLPEGSRPPGFQEWRKFGAPPGAPGQVLHHPAVQEHLFVAWILVMHFLSALQLIAADRMGTRPLDCPATPKRALDPLPPPMTVETSLMKQSRTMGEQNGDNEEGEEELSQQDQGKDMVDQNWFSLLFGEEQRPGEWSMNPVFCRTSFEPSLQLGLSTMIVDGAVAQNLDVMLPKSKMYYNRGWVLDLSEGEKRAKRNLNRFGGLGFVDSKKAYYALPGSKILKLFVPYQNIADEMPFVNDKAATWFKSIVWCEVNEKRNLDACDTPRDVSFSVGGVPIQNVSSIDAAGALYLGKQLCTHMLVPPNAVLTHRDDEEGKLKGTVGVTVKARVTNKKLINRDQACSLSHILWEQKKYKPAVDAS